MSIMKAVVLDGPPANIECKPLARSAGGHCSPRSSADRSATVLVAARPIFAVP